MSPTNHKSSGDCLLAIDTATELCSVALMNADRPIIERHVLDPQGHSRLLLGMIEEVLEEGGLARSKITAVSYDSGPGSFTGIRIGAGVAQGLALGLNVPLLGISSLMILSQHLSQELGSEKPVLAAIDARMNQVYWGLLRQDSASDSGWRWLETPKVSDPGELANFVEGCVGIGSGWDSYATTFQQAKTASWVSSRFPDASSQMHIAKRLIASGIKETWQEALPTYVRDKVTH